MPSSRGGGSSSRGPSINYRHSKTLKLPSSSRGTPDDWAATASVAEGLLADSYSLAVAMGDNVDSSMTPEDAAARLLTSREKSMYDDWTRKSRLPSADWRRTRASITGAPSHRRRWEALAGPLAHLYGERVSAENTKAWAEAHPEYMPLLIAVRKVDAARHFGRAARASSASRRNFFELMACRKLMSHIGTQRVKSSVEQKAHNKANGEREHELVKRLSRLDRAAAPSDRGEAEKIFEAKEAAWKKLTKTRTGQVTDVAALKKQNLEFTALEAMLRNRIAALERALEREMKGSSSKSSSRK